MSFPWFCTVFLSASNHLAKSIEFAQNSLSRDLAAKPHLLNFPYRIQLVRGPFHSAVASFIAPSRYVVHVNSVCPHQYSTVSFFYIRTVHIFVRCLLIFRQIGNYKQTIKRPRSGDLIYTAMTLWDLFLHCDRAGWRAIYLRQPTFLL